jgi:hypothetical protein
MVIVAVGAVVTFSSTSGTGEDVSEQAASKTINKNNTKLLILVLSHKPWTN